MDTDLKTMIEGLTTEELGLLRKMLGMTAKREAKLQGDTSKKLAEPIPFFNDRYRGERFYVAGKLKRFADGQFIALTEEEARVARKLGAHVFEGQDVEVPMVCRVCQRKFFNTNAMLWHLQFQHAVA